jgi:hypothetical protein
MLMFKRLGYVKEINGIGLSHAFDELAITVATNIKNNIIMHFIFNNLFMKIKNE